MTAILLLSHRHEHAVPQQTCLPALKFRADQALIAHRRFVIGTNRVGVLSVRKIPLCRKEEYPCI